MPLRLSLRAVAGRLVLCLVTGIAGGWAGFAGAASPATATPPSPGEYIAERGAGVLTIGTQARHGMPFLLHSYAANGHGCSLDGRIVRGVATLGGFSAGEGGEVACIVRFDRLGKGVTVSANQSCRAYCGSRAWFEGAYLRPAPGCGEAERKAARSRFKRLYDAKRDGEAVKAIAPLIARCQSTLRREEDARLRNDLAIAQYRLGRPADCVATLRPYVDLAAMSDDEIREEYPPVDEDTWLSIARATRFNQALCRKTR